MVHLLSGPGRWATRRRVMLGGLASGWAGAALFPRGAAAQSPIPPPHAAPRSGEAGRSADDPADDEAEITTLDAWLDLYGRPTASVFLGGRGAYRFLVDTGSTTSVLAMRHALDLGAVFLGMATVQGTTGAAEFAIARIPELSSGAITAREVVVAVAPEGRLGGEDGILGADLFAGRRLTFDVRARTVTVQSARASARWRRDPNLILRNGVLPSLRGRVGGTAADLVLDTGADHSILNPPLADRLARGGSRRLGGSRSRITGVTGHVLTGAYVDLPRLRMGGVEVVGAGGAVADAPVFALWGLAERPAMIVGMNVLSRLASFSIDYGARVFDAVPLAAALASGALARG